MLRILASSLFIVTVFTGSSAQSLNVVAPSEVDGCGSSLFTWSGGRGPYKALVLNISDKGTIVHNFGSDLSATSASWTPTASELSIAPNAVFEVSDDNGSRVRSPTFNIVSGVCPKIIPTQTTTIPSVEPSTTSVDQPGTSSTSIHTDSSSSSSDEIPPTPIVMQTSSVVSTSTSIQQAVAMSTLQATRTATMTTPSTPTASRAATTSTPTFAISHTGVSHISVVTSFSLDSVRPSSTANAKGQPMASHAQSAKLSTRAIVGIIAGALVGATLAVMAILLIVIRHRRLAKAATSDEHSSLIMPYREQRRSSSTNFSLFRFLDRKSRPDNLRDTMAAVSIPPSAWIRPNPASNARSYRPISRQGVVSETEELQYNTHTRSSVASASVLDIGIPSDLAERGSTSTEGVAKPLRARLAESRDKARGERSYPFPRSFALHTSSPLSQLAGKLRAAQGPRPYTPDTDSLPEYKSTDTHGLASAIP